MPNIHDETKDDPAGGDITVNAPSQLSPWAQGGVDLVEGAGRGIAKGVAGMIPESVEGKPWKDWASKYEPGSSQAEQWGEWGGDVGANIAPFFAGGPILEGVSQATKIPRFAEALNMLALRARTGGLIGQKGYKVAQAAGKTGQAAGEGAAGGAAEAAIHSENEKDPKKVGGNIKAGTTEGATTAAEATILRLGYEVLPNQIKNMVNTGALGLSVLGGGLLLRDKIGHGHWIPWHAIYSAAYPLYEMGKRALKLPPAAIGAGAERIREKMHPDSKPDEDERVPQ